MHSGGECWYQQIWKFHVTDIFFFSVGITVSSLIVVRNAYLILGRSVRSFSLPPTIRVQLQKKLILNGDKNVSSTQKILLSYIPVSHLAYRNCWQIFWQDPIGISYLNLLCCCFYIKSLYTNICLSQGKRERLLIFLFAHEKNQYIW